MCAVHRLQHMTLVTALTYWIIVALWLVALATVTVSYLRDPRRFRAMRLLLIVIGIDIVRNLVENSYFGLFFGAQYGLFPARLGEVLGNPNLLILPKLINIAAACAALVLLLHRWLPTTLKEQAELNKSLRQASDALRQEAEERRLLFETSLDLIFITDRRGTLLQVSPSSKATLGYGPAEMVGRSARDFIYPGDLERTRLEMRLARSGLETRNFETRYVHKDGRVVTLAWSGVWSEPEQRHYFFGRDMTERHDAEERLRHLAYHDHLTGLPNRISLRNDLAAILNATSSDEPHACAIAVFDLDRFKDINDTLGHPTGDQILQMVAERLMATSQSNSRLYRLGADEFVMMFLDCGDPNIISGLIEQAMKRLAAPFSVGDQELFITGSGGFAIAPAHGLDVDELIANADLALHEAKAAGGDRFRLFMPQLRAKAQVRRQLDTQLRRAVSEGEFVLYYQPQIKLENGMVVGAEALLRWQHPERGLLGPAAFIEALAESPVALDVGRWILQTACKQAASWSNQHGEPVRIGVNLFPSQLYSGALVEDVDLALRKSGLPADYLELEITENIALRQDEALVAPLHALHSRGIGIAFDDFGTGYASLIYLRRYPLTRIKIDQSFVRKISDRSLPKDAAIIRSIIQMAHNLGLQVVAEGVETADQEAFLITEKCDEAQGFRYAKPMCLEEFKSFLICSVQNSPRGFLPPMVKDL